MLKRLFLLLLFFVGVCQLSQAQISVGLKAGPMVSNTKYVGIRGGDSYSPKKLSYAGGLFANLNITDKIRIQPELLYSNKGFAIDGAIPGSPSRRDKHYLSVPVMIQYHVFEKLAIELGPEIGYMFASGLAGGDQRSTYIYPEEKRLDVLLNVGLNYYVTGRLSAGLRYNFGLYDTVGPISLTIQEPDGSVYIYNTDPDIRNRSIQLSVGYKLF